MSSPRKKAHCSARGLAHSVGILPANMIEKNKAEIEVVVKRPRAE
ncbi:MAG: hypothetical protein WCS42_15710 [Verrucomicrobiota bacterium]